MSLGSYSNEDAYCIGVTFVYCPSECRSRASYGNVYRRHKQLYVIQNEVKVMMSDITVDFFIASLLVIQYLPETTTGLAERPGQVNDGCDETLRGKDIVRIMERKVINFLIFIVESNQDDCTTGNMFS